MNYYESRVTKIPKKYIVNSILNTTWLADNTINYCKPISDDELHELLNLYSQNKDKNIESKLHNGLVWYAAYMASFTYDRYRKYYPSSEYSDFLAHCMERLTLKIQDWDPSKSNGATFYTRFVDDIRFSIIAYLHEYYGEGICKRGIITNATVTLAKIRNSGYSIKEALNLDDYDFKTRFGMTKTRFLSYLTHRETVSGNTKIIQSGEVSGEIFDFIEDKNSAFPDKIIDKVLSDEICELAKSKFKDRMIYFLIWKDYKSGNYTLTDLAEKYYDGDRTRERIRQIINQVDNKIMHNKKYVDIKNALDL